MTLINPEIDTKDVLGMINHLKSVIKYLESLVNEKLESEEEPYCEMLKEKGKRNDK